MTNNLQLVVPPADAAAIETHVAALEKLLAKYVKPLTPKEREQELKIGDKTIAFVDKVIEHAAKDSKTVPPDLDLTEVQRDYNVLKLMRPLARRLGALAYDSESTAMVASGDVYAAALLIYAQNALNARNAVAGAQAAYNEQRERFPGRGKKSEQ